MGSRFLVIALGVGVLATTGCYYRHRAGYGYGYYGAYSYQPTYAQPQGTVAGQPPPQGPDGQPQPQGVQVTAQMQGEGIAGSDGTRGWRVVVQAPQQEFQRLGQVAAQAHCQVEGSTQSEMRAVCNGGVHIVVRFDQQHIYKLCAPNTDQQVCAQFWSSFGG